MSENTSEKKHMIDYLYILFKWKKFILINIFIIIILTTTYSFLIPVTYKSTARITLANQQNNALGGLSNILSNSNPFFSMGSQLFGMNTPNQDLILGLLNSRTILTEAIKKFNLMKYYKIRENMDKTLKAFQSDVDFEPNENNLIEISVVNEDPKKAANIANYFVQIADSMNIKLNIEQAKNNKNFIAKRYQKNVKDLKAAQDSMYLFQKRTGIYVVPDQLVSAFQTAGELESELLRQQIAAEYARNQYGNNSPQYKMLTDQVNFIEDKINELKNSKTLSYPTNVLVPFGKLPKMMEEYFIYYREIDIQTKIMEFILPMYEQAKVEEQKSIPTLIVVDKAVPADLKYAPKRSLIIAGITLLFLFIFILIIFAGERLLNTTSFRNPLEEKEARFFQRIRKLYRLKF